MKKLSTNKTDVMLFIIFIICSAIVSFLVFTPTNNANAKLIDYQNYQKVTEALLDSIENTHGWLDTVGEADIYQEWIDARNKLN